MANPRYSVTDMGVFWPFAINARGQVVGYRPGSDTDPDRMDRAWLWEGTRGVDLGVLPRLPNETFARSYALGIDDQGTVVGSSGSFLPVGQSGNLYARPFLWQNGTLTELPPAVAGDAYAEAFAIGAAGQVVGVSGAHGFLRIRDQVTPLLPASTRLDTNGCRAVAINSRGDIVGATTVDHAAPGDTPIHACLYRNTPTGRSNRPLDLKALPGFPHSYATGINNQGLIVGFVTTEKMVPRHAEPLHPYHPLYQAYAIEIEGERRRRRAVVWAPGKATAQLPLLTGDYDSQANGVNGHGDIVGRSWNKAALWRASKAFDLNACIPPNSGWLLAEAMAINTRGQIAVAAQAQNSAAEHALLLTPV